MGFFGDLFLGSRPDYTYLPGVSDLMGDVRGWRPSLGKHVKSSKKLLRSLDAGEDVSNIGAFAPLQQDEAADLNSIDMDYMVGANALIGGAGGDQANLMNRMRDLAKERRRQDTGRQMVAMIPALRGQAMDTIERGMSRRQGMELDKYGLLSRLNSMQYDRRRQGGILDDIIKGAVGGLSTWGMGFLPKPGGATAGGS